MRGHWQPMAFFPFARLLRVLSTLGNSSFYTCSAFGAVAMGRICIAVRRRCTLSHARRLIGAKRRTHVQAPRLNGPVIFRAPTSSARRPALGHFREPAGEVRQIVGAGRSCASPARSAPTAQPIEHRRAMISCTGISSRICRQPWMPRPLRRRTPSTLPTKAQMNQIHPCKLPVAIPEK